MRKAAARTTLDFDLDFDDEPPARGERKLRFRMMSGATRFGVVGLAILSGAILVNAMFLQDQKHAAPLFRLELTGARTASPQAPVAPPLPAPRPAELSVAPPQSPAVESHGAGQAAIATAHVDLIARAIARIDSGSPHVAKTSQTSDPIGGLIRTVGAAPARSVEPDDSAVRAAQHALMRLGFVIKPDGLFGASTRRAIEQFERDRHLPVHGELTPAIQRALARAASGQAR